MLNPAPLFKQNVVIIGYVAGGVNAGPIGLKVLVYNQATGEFHAARLEEVGHWLCANTSHHHIRRDCTLSLQVYRIDNAFSPERFNRGIALESHAVGGVIAFEEMGHF